LIEHQLTLISRPACHWIASARRRYRRPVAVVVIKDTSPRLRTVPSYQTSSNCAFGATSCALDYSLDIIILGAAPSESQAQADIRFQVGQAGFAPRSDF